MVLIIKGKINLHFLVCLKLFYICVKQTYFLRSFAICFYTTTKIRTRNINKHIVLLEILVLTIFNEGAYLTSKSIFHETLNLF